MPQRRSAELLLVSWSTGVGGVMTEHVQLEIIAAVLVIAGQVVAVWRANVAASLAAMALIQTQQKNAAVQDIHEIVKVLKVEVNDRLTQLLSASRSAALLEGEATGTRQTRDAIASQQGHNDDPRLDRAVVAARQLISEAADAARNLVLETAEDREKKHSVNTMPSHAPDPRTP